MNDQGKDNKNKSYEKTISEETLTDFRNKLCAKLGNNTNAVLFHLLPTCENNIAVESDLNVGAEETVETTEHIIYESDEFINIHETIQQKNMSKCDFLNQMSDVKSSVAEELERRTRGQNDNPLWVQARKSRITASVFHDVLVRKNTTPSEKLVDKIIGIDSKKSSSTENVPALKWGRKMEIIAKKQYKAIKKIEI